MKPFVHLCLLLFALSAFVTSCKKRVPAQAKFIPKDAVAIVSINTKSLGSKLAENQETLKNILTSFTNDTSAQNAKQEWEELKGSGVDFEDRFFVAVVQKEGGASVTSVIGSLKDEGKLQDYLKKKDDKIEMTKEKDYSYSTMQGDKMIAWGKDVVMMVLYQKSFEGQMEYDTTSHTFSFKNPVSPVNDMKAEVDGYFAIKEEQSVAAIPEFRDLMADKSDATIWINSTASIARLPLQLPKLKELFASNFTAATVNFDDGKINFKSKSYYNQQLSEIIKKYSGSTVDLGLVENYPSDNIDGFAVISFNPQIVQELVRYLEVGGMVDGYLTKLMGANYTLSNALKAIKGDAAFIVSDLSVKSNGESMQPTPLTYAPNAKAIINIPIGDKVEMNRLLEKLVEAQMLVKINNEYKLPEPLHQLGWQLSVDEKSVLFSSSPELVAQYRANTKRANVSKEVMSNFRGKSSVFYINLENVLNGFAGSQNEVLAKAKETFKDLVAYNENFNGKYVEGHAELRFKNEKENSLNSFLSFIEITAKNIKTAKTPAIIEN
jgi:hypothetical protein